MRARTTVNDSNKLEPLIRFSVQFSFHPISYLLSTISFFVNLKSSIVNRNPPAQKKINIPSHYFARVESYTFSTGQNME